MKRLAFIILLTAFFLCGCSGENPLKGENPEYMVASLGFSEKNGKLTVFMEAIVINSEDTDAQKKLVVLEGNGDTVKQGAENAEKKAVQPVNLSHCGVIALEEGISKERFLEICEYCYNRDEINLSAFFISSDDVKKLLSEKPTASVAVGYDIMNRLESQKELSGREYKNRFYQIEAQKEKSNPHYDILVLEDEVFKDQNIFK